jgi:hypothetical protein
MEPYKEERGKGHTKNEENRVSGSSQARVSTLKVFLIMMIRRYERYIEKDNNEDFALSVKKKNLA